MICLPLKLEIASRNHRVAGASINGCKSLRIKRLGSLPDYPLDRRFWRYECCAVTFQYTIPCNRPNKYTTLGSDLRIVDIAFAQPALPRMSQGRLKGILNQDI